MQTKTLLGLVLLTLTTGCAKKTEVEAPTPDPAPAPAPAPDPAPAEPQFGPTLDAVLFETGGSVIAANQMDVIDEAAEVLESSDWSVIVVGLADAAGDAETNKRLSKERADAVANALRSKTSVSQDRIISIGIGERLATGESQSERKVELVFFRDTDLPYRQVVIRSGVLEADFRAKRATRGQ
ncbi:MAG TPA: OmpA family protein [Deltaproteobacteria bacterium]|nr:OmpA family protein [Deltaproteobacteria bacterium]